MISNPCGFDEQTSTSIAQNRWIIDSIIGASIAIVIDGGRMNTAELGFHMIVCFVARSEFVARKAQARPFTGALPEKVECPAKLKKLILKTETLT